MMSRSAVRGLRVVQARFNSASPKLTIAKNILALKGVSAANDAAALSSAVNVDVNNLPADLEWLSSYTSAPAAEAKGFKADPNAWQNKEFTAYVVEESSRHDTWPWVACGIATYVLLGVLVPLSFPTSERKNSKYVSMLEGRRGHMGDHHEHHVDSHAAPAHH